MNRISCDTSMEDIDEKVNEYWDGLVYDITKIDIPKYMNILKDRYGVVLEEYENMMSGDIQLTPEQAKEIYDYAYKTGLYKDYNPIQEYYRREVLKTLTKKLQNKTIIDLGCEDGRISIGLALFGKNTVYGIDMNEHAIDIAENKKSEYPGIAEKVSFKKMDYNAQEFYDHIKKTFPEGADTALFVQPVYAWFYARHRIGEILKPEGNMIVTMLHHILSEDEKKEKDRIMMDWDTYALKAGMSYEIMEYKPFYNKRAILIGEMKR